MMMSMMVAFSAGQNDDPSGPNIDLAPGSLQEKKMDVEKRGMGINDYNGDMRKGGRVGGGLPYRPPVSKEAAPGDAGSYYDKVMLLCPVSSLCVLCLMSFSRLDNILSFLTVLYFLLWFYLVLLVYPIPPYLPLPPRFNTTEIGLLLAVTVTDLAFDQSGLVPWGGGSLLSVLTTHCLQAPFPLQPHYPF